MTNLSHIAERAAHEVPRSDAEAGFGIVVAIFVLVLLASLGAAMLSLSSIERSTSTLGLGSARAMFAARAGLEWAMYRIQKQGVNCAGLPDGTSLALDAALSGFSVKIGCAEGQHSDGVTYTIYTLDATAEYGTYPNPDYVRKRMRATVLK